MKKILLPFLSACFILFSLMSVGCDLASSSGTDLQGTSGEVSEGTATTDSSASASASTSAEPVATASSNGSVSDIPVSSVKFLDANVAGWPQTTTLKASISGGTLHLKYDQANKWPPLPKKANDSATVNANPWVVVNRDGTWYAATFEWMRVGQTSKPTSVVTSDNGGRISRAPLNTFQPVSGEQYGFMVTTPARGGSRTINERSNISVLTWP